MRMTYTKLFHRILTSTIWGEDDKTRIVFITMLAMADAQGNVLSTIPGLARLAVVDVESVLRALEKFKSPDPFSGSPEYEGRRIEDLPGGGGWRLLNHGKYRDTMSEEHRQEYCRVKAREYRARSSPAANEKRYTDAIKRGASQEELDAIAADGIKSAEDIPATNPAENPPH